ncbi:MAG: GNAT family N-acetyltransferase [Candidatus Spyradocola sp.]
MDIRIAEPRDLETLIAHDRHITRARLERKIAERQVLVLLDGETFAGWLRWGLFWDEHPFMNLLYLLEPYRGKGLGRQLVEDWERRMKAEGHELVMTSTQANECAQFFYRRLGYEDAGSFALPGDPLELILQKAL